MKIKKNRNIIVFGIFIVSFIFFILYTSYFAFYNSQIICTKFEYISKVKGATYYNATFKVDNKKYISGISNLNCIEDISFDSLKKLDCIKVEYSVDFPSINRVVDKRVLK